MMTTPDERSTPVRLATRGGALLLTGVALYLLAPTLLEAFSSWDQVSRLEGRWFAAVGMAQIMSWAFVWALQRLVIGTKRWIPVVTSQLAGNAATRLIPGGGAAGLTVQYQMLRAAGIDTAGVGLGLAAVGIIQLATNLALPILVLPILVTDPPAEPRLTSIALSAAAFFVLLLAIALLVLNGNRLLSAVGNLVDAVRRLVSRSNQQCPTAQRLLARRDELKVAFEPNWVRAVVLAVGRATFDFLSLLTAVAAFGLTPRPSLVLLAFAGASLLAMIPITPGGLGFVEAGLTGLLVLAGVPASESVGVAFLYRLFSFWLPIPVGMIAGAIHGVRYRAE